VNERAAAPVDSPLVSGHEQEERVSSLLGGGLLSERMRHAHDGTLPDLRVVERETPAARPDEVTLGPATQIEVIGHEVSFLVPFVGKWPNEHWLQAFRETRRTWPGHLTEPLMDEGRGLHLGPIQAAMLEEHVNAVKARVAEANRLWADEIEPELRRQREEAIRREHEELRIQAEVQAKLKSLLG
jgi:hypothetical protein